MKYVQEVTANQEHFDKVKMILENTFKEIMAEGGNGRLARVAKETFQMLDGFTNIVKAIDDHQNNC